MVDRMASQVAKHTVEITERDVVIETLRSMVPQEKLGVADKAVSEAVAGTISEEE